MLAYSPTGARCCSATGRLGFPSLSAHSRNGVGLPSGPPTPATVAIVANRMKELSRRPIERKKATASVQQARDPGVARVVPRVQWQAIAHTVGHGRKGLR